MTAMQLGYRLQKKQKMWTRLDILGSAMYCMQLPNLVRLIVITKKNHKDEVIMTGFGLCTTCYKNLQSKETIFSFHFKDKKKALDDFKN